MRSPVEADLVRRDTALPGLVTVLDPGAFTDTLARLAPGLRVRDARLGYLRYKPGRNCLGAFTVLTTDASVMVHAKALRRDDRPKLAKARQRAIGSGRFFEPDLALEVCVFPADNKLPQLSLIMNAAWRRDFLTRRLPNQPELHGASLRTLAYKPERRWVGALEVNGVPRAVCKLHTRAAFDAILPRHDTFQSGEVLRLASCLGRAPYRGALFQAWQAGSVLSEAWGQEPFDAGTLEQVGFALGELHRQRPRALPLRRPEARAEALEQLGRQVGFLLPGWHERATSAAGRLASWLRNQPRHPAATHGDFYAKQVLLQDGQVVILDLDEAGLGDPTGDLGSFLAHLEREVIYGRLTAGRREAYRGAFLSGHRRALGDHEPKRLAGYTATALFERLPQFFRSNDPDWPALTTTMLEQVEALTETATTGTRRSLRPSLGSSLRRELLDPQIITPHVASALAQRHPDVTVETVRRATPLRVKPARRALIDYELSCRKGNGPAERWTVLGKWRARGVDRRTWDAMVYLWENGFAGDSASGVSIPEPLGLSPPLAMWFQQKVDAPSLAHLLAGPHAVRAAVRAAEGLGRLHAASVPLRRRHGMADELSILERRLDALAHERSSWRQRLNDLFTACTDLASQVQSVPASPIHRDFYQDQMLVRGDRVWLVDLDLLCGGDPALDAGNFVGHLIEWGLRAPDLECRLRVAGEAFIERFLRLTPRATRDAVEAYATLTLARHVSLSTRIPERRPFTETILKLCEARCRISPASARTISPTCCLS